MDNQVFERTQAYLSKLIPYLESLYSGHEESDPSPFPARIEHLLQECGYLEGMRLKEQGFISSELEDFIQNIGFAFEIEAKPGRPFKLPFVGNEIAIQRKTLNAFMEKAWVFYHSALLSAYSLRNLNFESQSPDSAGMETVYRITESSELSGLAVEEEGFSNQFAHKLNNYMSGIISYTSLMLSEQKEGPETLERLQLIWESAQKSADLIKDYLFSSRDKKSG